MARRRSQSRFRFYEELNDFLAPRLRGVTFEHDFDGTPSVKDRIEALGVPHTEVDLALAEHRIILTRDIGLLKNGRVTHGAFVHATESLDQVSEMVERFHLENLIRPWHRCSRCNGQIDFLAPADVAAGAVPEDVRARFERIGRCRECARHYWPGSHYDRLCQRLRQIGLVPDGD